MPSSSPKPAKSTPERRCRRHPRYRISLLVTVGLLLDNAYQRLRGQGSDLSIAGIGVLLGAELAGGEVVSLNFSLPNSLPWEVRAVLRHRRGYKYGFEFLSLSVEQKNQIADYIKELPRAD